MSVVNRMLQDIDRRLTERGSEPNRVYPEIRSVPVAPGPSRRGALGIGVAIAAIAGLAVTWEAMRDGTGARAIVPASISAGPVAAAPRATPAASSAPAAPPAEAPVAIAQPEEAAVASRTLKLAELLSEVPSVPPARAPVARAEAPPRAEPPRSDAVAKPTLATVTRTNTPVRQVAPEETVDAARALWAEGARGAAVATLGGALAAAEASRNPGATVELARELARLEMADNRAREALDMLKRLEGILGGDADAWALRGNAEQRLALHHDAAASYLAALRLKPGQGRWMLGAAISLAADGKRGEAQAWVGRARELGAITPPIAAYLQQIGIEPR